MLYFGNKKRTIFYIKILTSKIDLQSFSRGKKYLNQHFYAKNFSVGRRTYVIFLHERKRKQAI